MRRRGHGALRKRYGRMLVSEKTCPAGAVVQTLLFPRDRFTEAKAREWAHRHDWKFGDVDVKDHFIHLRQEDPARFTRIRTVFLGGSGVQARVGWPKC